MLPLSPEPMRSSSGNSVESVEQPWPKIAVDREGNANANLQSDTVEVFATFTDDDAFFGLTSYLRYVGEQLSTLYGFFKSLVVSPRPYEFPWRYVDDGNVEVEGFIKPSFLLWNRATA